MLTKHFKAGLLSLAFIVVTGCFGTKGTGTLKIQMGGLSGSFNGVFVRISEGEKKHELSLALADLTEGGTVVRIVGVREGAYSIYLETRQAEAAVQCSRGDVTVVAGAIRNYLASMGVSPTCGSIAVVEPDGDVDGDTGSDGDQEEGDADIDGDTEIDGDTVPDGDTSVDGDTVDGDTTPDGDTSIDGDTTPDGDTVDGDSELDGDTADGDTAPDGDTITCDTSFCHDNAHSSGTWCNGETLVTCGLDSGCAVVTETDDCPSHSTECSGGVCAGTPGQAACNLEAGLDGVDCGSDDQCVDGACEDCYDLDGCNDLTWGERVTECAAKECVSHTCGFDDYPETTACGGTATECQKQDYCDGSGRCPDRGPQDNGAVCGTQDQCAMGTCADCFDDSGCGDLPDDLNDCTDQFCYLGECTDKKDDTNTCDDNDPCTLGDACDNGACNHASVDFACADPDHDRVCPYAACAVNATDTCPSLWNPDNDPALCEAWSTAGAGWMAMRSIDLSKTVGSTWRRTYEPVEIPLQNGILNDSVVGYWKLDDGKALNYSGSGIHGSFSSTVPIKAVGLFNDEDGALQFTTNQSTQIFTNIGKGESYPTLSVMLWFKSTSTSGFGEGNFFCGYSVDGTATAGRFRIYGNASGKILFTVNSDGYITDSRLDDMQWHLAALSYNGSFFSAYLDGTLVVQKPITGPITPAEDFRIGARGGWGPFGGAPEHVTAYIDEVTLFSHALSPDEIRLYYESRMPYGTTMVPGAQEDFDDLRVTEKSTQVSGAMEGHLTPHELLGPRPHSDTPCPSEYAETSITDVPNIADREDLCGIVGYWKLDGDTRDSSGNGHDGTNHGAMAINGRFGDAIGGYSFSGSTYISENNSSAFRPANQITVEAWINASAAPARSMSIVGNTESSGYGIEINDTGFPRFSIRGTSDYVVATSSVAIHVDQWHHIAGVYNGTEVAIYLDGIKREMVSYTGQINYPYPRPIILGGSPAWGGGMDADTPYIGKLDDVLIHDVAKSADYIFRRANPGVPTVRFLGNTEIVADGGIFPWMNYNLHWGNQTAAMIPAILKGLDGSTCVGLLSPCSGYAGWWRLNEGGGKNAADSSTNKNNGILMNDAAWVEGREGTAIAFDGNDDCIKIDDSASLSIIQDITLEATINMAEMQDNQMNYILSKINGENDVAYAMDFNNWSANGTFHFKIADGADACSVGTTTGFIPETGVWYHVAGTYGNNSHFTSWDDWDIDQTRTCGLSIADSTEPLLIGTFKEGWDTEFNGLIDSVRIMSRALEPDEFLHYPLAAWSYGPLQNDDGTPLDSDSDGVSDDGDGSGVAGDRPCTGAETTGCDDNCPFEENPDQEDVNEDGVGDACDPSLVAFYNFTGSVPSDWTLVHTNNWAPSTIGWSLHDGILEIHGGQSNGGGGGSAVYRGDAIADISLSADLQTPAGPYSAGGALNWTATDCQNKVGTELYAYNWGLLVRFNATNRTGYGLHIVPLVGGGACVLLGRLNGYVSGGNYTIQTRQIVLASMALSDMNYRNINRFYLKVKGSTITGRIDSYQPMSVTDATYSTGNYALHNHDGKTYFDNVEVRDCTLGFCP